MATTTPNYGWAVPTSTDLVKDGATAIETLGDSIDASMFTALGTKKSGLVLLNTTTFTLVTSQAIDGVFSSSYDNYRIVLSNFIGAASGNDIRMQGRVAGVTQTAANYGFGSINISSTGITFAAGGSALTTGGSIGFTETTLGNGSVVDIYCPNKNIETGWNFATKRANSANGYFGWGAYQNTAQLTGFILSASGGGNISGTVSVYGYNY
jgi:hypothetical protein